MVGVDRSGTDAIGDVGIMFQVPLCIDLKLAGPAALEITVLDEMVPSRFEVSPANRVSDVRILAQVPLFIDRDTAQQQFRNVEKIGIGHVDPVAVDRRRYLVFML